MMEIGNDSARNFAVMILKVLSSPQLYNSITEFSQIIETGQLKYCYMVLKNSYDFLL